MAVQKFEHMHTFVAWALDMKQRFDLTDPKLGLSCLASGPKRNADDIEIYDGSVLTSSPIFFKALLCNL